MFGWLLVGKGWVACEGSSPIRYSRVQNFYLMREGELTSRDGSVVEYVAAELVVAVSDCFVG